MTSAPLQVKCFVQLNGKQQDFELFLENHRAVEEYHPLDTMNATFTTTHNFFFESKHENEREYIAFLKGLKETFQLKNIFDFHVL